MLSSFKHQTKLYPPLNLKKETYPCSIQILYLKNACFREKRRVILSYPLLEICCAWTKFIEEEQRGRHSRVLGVYLPSMRTYLHEENPHSPN